MAVKLNDPVTVLPGVGKTRAEQLGRLGLKNLWDLLNWFPRGYEDRRTIYSIREAPLGEQVCISAVVASQPHTARLRNRLTLTRVKAVDETDVLELTFFNQPYIGNALKVGETCVFCGVAEQTGKRKTMTNPVFEPAGAGQISGKLLPVYPLTEGVNNKLMCACMRSALSACSEQLEEPLPLSLRDRYDLMPVADAYREIHLPQEWEPLQKAKRRLVFEELFYLAIGLCRMKGRRDRSVARCISGNIEDFYQLLPFTLTGAQRRAIEDCAADLAKGMPMNRLVQGDVGSGKTMVAAAAAYLTIKSGLQAALMAPTEILAEQHYRTLSGLLAPAGIRVALLTGSMKAKEKRELNECLQLGMIDLVIGTHALISGGVDFLNLGLVITDEQHRFGVQQRARLAEKGVHPHVLVMSATPIPRTLALMIYGDLDVSIIDELPPGRQPVETFRVHTDKRPRMYGFVRQQVEEGHQVYIVCPAVEETDEELLPAGAVPLQNVNEYVKQLKSEIFPDLRVEEIHGKMKPKAKELIMASFAAGEIDVLVSTTVIEVGVDVPNANLMIVENAERFGMSQLHQLRGRVGRGAAKSYCVLVSDARGEEAQARLKTLCSTNDGFRIAEEDLKMRGPGDFFGSRQHGLPQLKVADLAGDTRVLAQAQEAASALLAEDPALEQPEHQAIRGRVQQLFEDSEEIFN